MKAVFEELLERTPLKTADGIPFFGGEEDGDRFSEEDLLSMRNGGLEQNWTTPLPWADGALGPLLREIAREGRPVVDLASGPGLGLLPSLYRLAPALPTLVVDANAGVLAEWRRFFREKGITDPPDLLEASLYDLPFRAGSAEAFTSMIGISSTRNGEEGYRKALREIARALSSGGVLYAVENEWVDVPGILSLFQKAGETPWDVFLERQLSWRERFDEGGLTVESEALLERRRLRGNREDNELGDLSERYGVPVYMDWKLFTVRKG